jgi:hypothetical protein
MIHRGAVVERCQVDGGARMQKTRAPSLRLTWRGWHRSGLAASNEKIYTGRFKMIIITPRTSGEKTQ